MGPQWRSPNRDELYVDGFHFRNDNVSSGFLVEPTPYILLGSQPHTRADTETFSFLGALFITG